MYTTLPDDTAEAGGHAAPLLLLQFGFEELPIWAQQLPPSIVASPRPDKSSEYSGEAAEAAASSDRHSSGDLLTSQESPNGSGTARCVAFASRPPKRRKAKANARAPNPPPPPPLPAPDEEGEEARGEDGETTSAGLLQPCITVVSAIAMPFASAASTVLVATESSWAKAKRKDECATEDAASEERIASLVALASSFCTILLCSGARTCRTVAAVANAKNPRRVELISAALAFLLPPRFTVRQAEKEEIELCPLDPPKRDLFDCGSILNTDARGASMNKLKKRCG